MTKGRGHHQGQSPRYPLITALLSAYGWFLKQSLGRGIPGPIWKPLWWIIGGPFILEITALYIQIRERMAR